MEIVIPSLRQLPQAAAQFVNAYPSARVIAFHGKMGSGKTTFIKALCQQLGVTDTVCSPTFAIVNEYRDAQLQPIYHFDFYRLQATAEALDIGCLDLFNSGNLCLIEWPDIVLPLLPPDTLHVFIEEQPDGGRRITMTPPETLL